MMCIYLFLLACWFPIVQAQSIADIVVIIPDRSTAYPNGLHNGILTSAYKYNVTFEVRDVGDFDIEKSKQVLTDAIESEEQPKIYCIWPVDRISKKLVRRLYEVHNVPIIQLNQLPGEDTQWEWDHLLGYAGPDDALRARNAGLMLIDAMKERQIENPNIVTLGYPDTYGGYHLSIAAFRNAINGTNLTIIHDLPLDWGNQPAYNAMIRLIDEMKYNPKAKEIHGVYAMDDNILKGAYEALNDAGLLSGQVGDNQHITLVGTVCNGARELIETGKQYGTTIQAPFLEAALGIDSAVEYLLTGQLQEKIRFTPNPIATQNNWESMIIPFLNEIYSADNLCTWSLYHERTNGFLDPDDAYNICDYIDCLFIPKPLILTGYILAGINIFIAAVSGILLYIYRNKKVIQLAQPFFLSLVIAGSIVDTSSIIFMSNDNRNTTGNSNNDGLDRSCMAWPVLLTLGQMMTTATLVAKIYRVKVVIGDTASRSNNNNSRMVKRTKVTIKDVSGFIVGGLLVDFIILMVWYITDPFHWSITAVSRDHSNLIIQARGECKSDGAYYWVYPLIIIVLHFVFLIYANVLAYQTRTFHEISDSKMVAVSLFNSIQLLLMATVMVGMAGDNVAISYFIRVVYAFLNNFGVLLLIVVIKIVVCLKGNGDRIPDLHRLTTTHSSADRPRNNSRISGLNFEVPLPKGSRMGLPSDFSEWRTQNSTCEQHPAVVMEESKEGNDNEFDDETAK